MRRTALLESFRHCLKITKAGGMKTASQLYSSTLAARFIIIDG